MKKNIKLTKEQRGIVMENVGKFKGEILSKIASDFTQSEGGEGGYTEYVQSFFTREFNQRLPWTKKS